MAKGTYHERNTLLVGDLGDGFEVRDIIPRVADGFDINGLGTVINGRGQVLRVVALNEFGVDAQSRQEDLKLVIGAAVKIARGNDVIACVGKGTDCHELGRLTRGSSHRSHTVLESRYSLFKDIHRGLDDRIPIVRPSALMVKRADC
jgi:hypothetical protein